MWRVRTDGDPRAFALLVERWEAPILAVATRMTGDRHAAEDIKQTAFARVYEKRRDYQPSARFSTYLWRITLNLCYDELRRGKRRGRLEGSAAESESILPPDLEAAGRQASPQPGPDLETATREEGDLVRRALLQLPEPYREVLVLRHYEGLKLREIAEVLAIPEGTVNSRMAEALARLSRLLEPELGSRPVNARASAPPQETRESPVL